MNSLKNLELNSKRKLFYAVSSTIIFVVAILTIIAVVYNKELSRAVVNTKSSIIKKLNLPTTPAVAEIPLRKDGAKDPNILARYVGLLDIDSGTFLYSKNKDVKIPIASVTKVMTATVVVDNFNLNDVIEVSKESAQTTGSVMQLRAGEKITANSLLYGMLIPSGNDAAYTFAEHYGKVINPKAATRQEAIDAFVGKMNEKAAQLGLKNTHYLDPAGLNDDAMSTANDQGILLANALRNKTITNVIHTPEIDITSVDGSIVHKINNSNRLVTEDMLYPGIIGGKTGFTPASGHNLVTVAQRNNHRLVAIIFNTYDTSAPASAIEARKLLDWGFNNYQWEKLY